MLVISGAAMATFDRLADVRLADQVQDVLLAHFPQLFRQKTQAEQTQIIGAACANARRAGVVTERGIFLWVFLNLAASSGEGAAAAVGPLLNQAEISDDFLDLLFQRLVDNL